MARPRASSRVLSRSFYDSHTGDVPLPPALRELLDEEHPCVPHVTHAVMRARMAGEDPMDTVVMGRCIQEGHLAYVTSLVTGDMTGDAA